MERCPTQAVLPLVGLAVDKVTATGIVHGAGPVGEGGEASAQLSRVTRDARRCRGVGAVPWRLCRERPRTNPPTAEPEKPITTATRPQYDSTITFPTRPSYRVYL
ncbi:MAG: hypothetical protein R6U98_10665 [Pirellulaceae bacterium]